MFYDMLAFLDDKNMWRDTETSLVTSEGATNTYMR